GTTTWLIADSCWPPDKGVVSRRRAGGLIWKKINPPLAFRSFPPLTGGRQKDGSYGRGVRLLGIDAVLLDCIGHRLRLAFAVIGQCLERGDNDEAAIYLEEMSQLRARIGATETIGAKHPIGTVLRDEGSDAVGE